MKWLAGSLLVAVVLLQYRLWLSDDGVRELARLSDAVEQQKADNAEAVEDAAEWAVEAALEWEAAASEDSAEAESESRTI